MKTKKPLKQVRNRYSPEFKQQALDRAKKDGVAVAARDLKLKDSQLYSWRQSQQRTGETNEQARLQHAELARLRRDNARLEEENSFLKKAAAYFAKATK